MELSGLRIFFSSLMICFAPISAAALSSFYTPDYYPASSQYTVGYPTLSGNQQSRTYPQIGNYWQAPQFIPRKASYHQTPYNYYQGYRFRPLQPVTRYRPVSRPQFAHRYIANYRWRPVDDRQFASQWPSQRANSRSNWQMAEGNRYNPYSKRAPWDNGHYAARPGVNDSNGFRFRPVAGSERRFSPGHNYRYSSIPHVNRYSYRPLKPISRPFVTKQSQDRASVANRSEPGPDKARPRSVSLVDSRLLDGRNRTYQHQAKAPVSTNVPGFRMSNREVYGFRPSPNYPFQEKSRLRSRHYVHYSQPHYYPSPYLVWNAPFMPNGSARRGTSASIPPRNNLHYVTNGYQQPTYGQTETVANWYNGWSNREGAWYGTLQSKDWPLVSQDDQSERTMINDEKNNF